MPQFWKPPFYTQEQIAMTEERDMHFPYSDKWLTYDPVYQGYIPTRELLIEHGIKLSKFGSTPDQINTNLREMGRILYNFMNKANGSNMQVIKYIVARSWRDGISPYRVRKLMEEIFIDQCRYWAVNGNIEMYNGVDITNGQVLPRAQLRKEDRDVFAKIIGELDNLGLFYKGAYERESIAFSLGNIYSQNDW